MELTDFQNALNDNRFITATFLEMNELLKIAREIRKLEARGDALQAENERLADALLNRNYKGATT